jgi:hypothetical protein
MTGLGWTVVQGASRFLGHNDREAVLGDVAEGCSGFGRAVTDVLDLVIRRQVDLWKSWRPWIAAFALAMPCSLLLMGLSLSVSKIVAQIALRWDGAAWWLLLLGPLLLGWSWAGGYVAGSLSKRTLWASAVCCLLPCLFCLSRFHGQPVSKYSLLVFVLPAIWGAWQGLRGYRVPRRAAIGMALGITVLAVATSSGGTSLFYCVLIWPAWYMAAAMRRDSQPN